MKWEKKLKMLQMRELFATCKGVEGADLTAE